MTEPDQAMLGRWTRPRGFGKGPYGPKWWVASVNHDGRIDRVIDGKPSIPVTATGMEIIEVLEIATTITFGDIVFYRQWFVDPDGNEVTISWAPKRADIEFRTVAGMRTSLANLGMKREAVVTRLQIDGDLSETRH
jgi:hypothetical protein